MEETSKRAARRAATLRICERRVRDWTRVAYGTNFRAEEPGRLKKSTVWYCNCRKRRKGSPRIDVGMCDYGDRDRIYWWRRLCRELQNLVCRDDLTEESLDLVLRK